MKAYDIAPKRKAVGISQQELAAAMGWGERTMGDVELGRVDITEEMHSRLLLTITTLSAQIPRKEVIAA